MIMHEHFEKVAHLAEALPYIQKYSGKFFVIKYGGAALKNESIAHSTIKDIVLLNSVGIKVILVHGGGPEINDWLSKLNIEVKFKDGLRVTDAQTMEIVEMVLHGKIQRQLVTMINCSGARGIGISGRDGRIVVAERHPNVDPGDMVGKIIKTNLKLLHQILDLGLIPVISSIAPDEQGKVYNINADDMTAQIAIDLKAHKMMLMTDVAGVLEDSKNNLSLIPELSCKQAQDLMQSNLIYGGMIPKINSCIEAVANGVQEAIILNGLEEHCLLLETFTNQGSGTRIT